MRARKSVITPLVPVRVSTMQVNLILSDIALMVLVSGIAFNGEIRKV